MLKITLTVRNYVYQVHISDILDNEFFLRARKQIYNSIQFNMQNRSYYRKNKPCLNACVLRDPRKA